jgi:hypothetical protein
MSELSICDRQFPIEPKKLSGLLNGRLEIGN